MGERADLKRENKALRRNLTALQERLEATESRVQTLEGLLDECQMKAAERAMYRPSWTSLLASDVSDEAKRRWNGLLDRLGLP